MNFRVAIDGIMILSLVFFAGVGWTRIDAFANQLDHVTGTVQSLTAGGERLARIETKLDRLTEDVNRLQDERHQSRK